MSIFKIEKWKMRIIYYYLEDENNLLLSGLLKISYQIFKVSCFMLYFTSTGKTKLSYRTLAKKVLRTAHNAGAAYRQ